MSIIQSVKISLKISGIYSDIFAEAKKDPMFARENTSQFTKYLRDDYPVGFIAGYMAAYLDDKYEGMNSQDVRRYIESAVLKICGVGFNADGPVGIDNVDMYEIGYSAGDQSYIMGGSEYAALFVWLYGRKLPSRYG
jgi:hypothetical protein